MPLGTRHTLTGLLLQEGVWVVLQLDDGGCWRLDIPHRYRNHLGRRARVEGVRSGFDLLDVIKVTLL